MAGIYASRLITHELILILQTDIAYTRVSKADK